jgi:hypothetical protein
MVRSGISYDNLMLQTRRLLGNAPGELTVDSGADPAIFLQPSGKPTDLEVSKAIVHGLAAGVAKLEGGLFSAPSAGIEDFPLSSGPSAARYILAHSYGDRGRLTEEFVRALAHDRKGVLSRLQDLYAKARSQNNGVPAGLFDEEAVRAVEREVDLVWPYVKRLRRIGS